MVCPNCGAQLSSPNMRFCTVCGASIEPAAPKGPQMPDLRAVWPDLDIQGQVGRGPGSVVYQAARRGMSGWVAVKVQSIPADPSELNNLLARGMDEVHAETYFSNVVNEYVSKLQLAQSMRGNPHIVGVEDFKVVRKDRLAWDIYVRMELLTPFSTIEFGMHIAEAAVLKLGLDLCNALDAYNAKSGVHCNIKPENIFIDNNGNYKLGDFGSALRQRNLPQGASQDYSAPEVAGGAPSDIRSDIYSVGLVLYQLLNERCLPFGDAHGRQYGKYALQRRLSGEQLPAPCCASAQMAQVIAQACAYNPAERFATVAQLREALQRVAGGSYGAAPVADPSAKSSKSKKLTVALIIVVALTILTSLALVGVALFADREEERENDRRKDRDEETVQTQPPTEETQPFTMPNCIGMPYTQVVAYFEGSGCTPIFTYEYSDVIAEDCIIEQSIAANTILTDGTKVELVVSKGADVSPTGYNQKVVVTAASGSSYGTMVLYDWEDGQWVSKFSCDVTVGQKGISSDYGEGKKRTPLGTFKLGVALSANSIPNSSWPLYRVSSDTCVVDDTSSDLYNTIQSIGGLPRGVDYDPIGKTITSGKCNVCIFIEHNGDGLSSDGVVAGKGSVITICGRTNSIAPTLGCVDISAGNMNTLLSMLDYSKNPHIELEVL